jgi:glycosyltransferase involved in cell wall biosynthesis
VILILHNRYRTTGGEERAVADHLWLLRTVLGEEAEVLERDSALLGRPRAAVAMLGGGLRPDDVAAAVRRARARIVHAHNVNPSFGWRALAAARAAGARVVLHAHNYRLVCAVGTCFTRGADCTRCHGRNTWPGVRLRCRGPLVEAAVYGAGLAAWQRRIAGVVDLYIVPSRFAEARLRELGAPLDGRTAVVPHCVRDIAEDSRAARGRYVLVAGRLAPEKGIDDAIAAGRREGLPLVVAGAGPELHRLERLAEGADVSFTGALAPAQLRELRRGAALAAMPSRSAETFGLAAAEAMADGVPVVATRIGALPELVDEVGLVPPGDVVALGAAMRTRFGDEAAGRTGIELVRRRAAPQIAAAALADAYAHLE